jgi:type I restriction enzyme S subunit
MTASTWVDTNLGELTEILSGFAFSSKNFGDEGDLPVIRIRNVVSGSSNTFYSGEYDDKFIIENGDLLIGMDGEFNRAKWQGGRALLNQRVCRISSASAQLDEQYLFHFLPSALKRIEDTTPFVTVKHLSVKKIEAIPISLPPLEEQKRIAGILDAADHLRTKRQQTIEKLDSLRQAVFVQMFGDQMQNPFGWERKLFPEIFEDITKSHKKTKQSEYLSAGHHPIIDQGSKLIAGYSNDIDTLSQADLPVIIFGDHTRCFKFIDFPFGIGADGVKVLRPKTSINPVFAFYFLRELRLTDSGYSRHFKFLKRTEVSIPPSSLQLQFANIIEASKATEQRLNTSAAAFEPLFSSLQQRAFRGDL